MGPSGAVLRHAPLQLRAQSQSVSKDRLAQTVQQREVEPTTLPFDDCQKTLNRAETFGAETLLLLLQPSGASPLESKAFAQSAELRSVIPGKNTVKHKHPVQENLNSREFDCVVKSPLVYLLYKLVVL